MPTYSVEQHIALQRVTQFAVSPDGRWLAVAVQRLDQDGANYVSDIWRVPTNGDAAVQLTRGDSKDAAPCFRHDGALGFLSNRKPNEQKADEDAEQRMQVWLLQAEGGEPLQLTDEPLGVESFAFARAADRLVLLAPVLPDVPHDKQRETAAQRKKHGPSARHFTQQPVRHWDHWLHDNTAFANTHLIACDSNGQNRVDQTPLAQRELAIEPEFDVSADGRYAVVTWAKPGADRVNSNSLLLIDLQMTQTRVFDCGDLGDYTAPKFSPDGTRIATTQSARSPRFAPRPTLKLIGTATGTTQTLAPQWDRTPTVHDWSADCGTLYVTADDNGHTPIFAINVQTNEVQRVSSISVGGAHDCVSPLPDGRLACVRSTLLNAPECVALPAQTGSVPHQLAALSGYTPKPWVDIESFTARSSDGTDVQSFLVKPRGVNGKLPTLLWIHGGPIGMSADSWHWRWNPLLAVAQGYAVVLANPRGSTGFGQDFVQGIWGNVWGEQCFRDLMAIVDALAQRPDTDAQRLAAMGGSFGGYMTNWIGTQTNRFKCLVTHASIVTMAQFTGTTDHPPWWYLEMGGEDPYADAQRFDRYAPIKHIKHWKTPALIIHGELDYRCPIGEGLNLFEALQYHQVPSELLVFPDENHWIQKPRNIVAWYDAVLRFLNKHLQ